MKLEAIERIEKTGLEKPAFDRLEKMAEFNKSFKTTLLPEKGAYGVTERITENGILERRGLNEFGQKRTEFYSDGKIFESVEKINDTTRLHIKYDDNGKAFLMEKSVRGDNPSHSIELAPNLKIEKGNITTITDEYGRPVYSRITDFELSPAQETLSRKLKDSSYLEKDQIGHLIPDSFGGPASKENVVPQTSEVNQSQIKRVENIARNLKKEGHSVDYAVKTNYDTSINADGSVERRPSSFEPEIYVDGKKYTLEESLQKIYNGELDAKGRLVTNAKEGVNRIAATTAPMREVGRQQGIEAATVTCAISTVDNVILFVDGEISADEMAFNIAKDTGTAAALGYGSGFISEGIAIGMQQSGNQLIQSLAGSNVPAGMVSFGVTSYEAVVDFAQGKIDVSEFAYDMGNNAVGVSGSMIGAQYGAAAGTMIMPGVGTIAGGLVGGMVGYAVTSEAYATAVEYGSKGAEALGTKAKQIAGATIEYAQDNVPEKAGEIKAAINTFASQNNLPFNFA